MMLFACALFAQSGSISGTVKTLDGNMLSNATVNLENINSGVRQSAITDNSGKYVFDNLPGGTYRLSLSTAQFTGTPSEEITLDAARPKTVDITVQNSGATTVAQIQVEESTPELDTATPRIVTTYNTRDVQYLPAPNYMAPDGAIFGAYNLSMLSAGVANSGGFSIAKGPVVGGQSPIQNNFYVEGVDNNNRANPGPLVYVPNEATTEFQAYQNQFPAEFGGHAGAGQFNTIMRTGTNQFHGALYDYLQNRNLNAVGNFYANAGVRDLPGYDQNRMGGNLGFPIIHNKLFFFGDFEYIPLGVSGYYGAPSYAPTAGGYAALSANSRVSPTNLSVLRNYAGAAATASSFATVGGQQIPVGILNNGAKQWQNQFIGAGSLDWNISNSDQLRGRYVHNLIDANNDGATLAAFYTPRTDRALMASVAEYHNFASGMVNELRLGYTRYHQTLGGNSASFPGLSAFPNINIQQDLNLQLGSPLSANVSALNTYQLADNVNLQLGRHQIKFGADARRFIGPLTFNQFGNGNFTYSTLQTFLYNQSPEVNGYQSFGNLNYSGGHYDTYAYVDDMWRMAPNFTLNLGVKYSYVSLPSTLTQQGYNSVASVPGLISFNEPNTQKTAFAPIVGIAFSPGFVKNTVVRAGFTMNYDTTYGVSNLPTVPPGTVTTAFVPSYGYYPGFFPGYFGTIVPINYFTPSITPAQARRQTTTYIPDQQLPYTMNWDASWQQQVFHHLVFEARYLGVKSIHLPVSSVLGASSAVSATTNLPIYYTAPTQAQLNASTLTLANLRQMTNANNPYYAAGFTNPISSIQPWGWSWYNGLALQATNRFGAGLQATIAYTWSHTIDDLSGPNFGLTGYSFVNQLAPKGNSVFDHRHRVSATMLWDLGAVGKNSFVWLRDVLANMTFGGTYTYETPSSVLIQSAGTSEVSGYGLGGVIVNPNGISNTGSGLTPLRNTNGNIVGYQVTNPNAQYIAGAPGVYTNGLRNAFGLQPINNFNAMLYKRFAIRDRFSFEIHGEAYNVLNHPQFTAAQINAIAVNPYALQNFLIPGTTSFANPGLAFSNNARMLQVGLRFLW